MKSSFLPVLVASLGLVLVRGLPAQTFSTLYSFTATAPDTNNDGARPLAGLIVSGTTLYGTTVDGGADYSGTLFAVNIDGTGFRTLHSFSSATEPSGSSADLLLAGRTLYGTTSREVFSVNNDGTGFTVLHLFTYTGGNCSSPTNTDGAGPGAGLSLS